MWSADRVIEAVQGNGYRVETSRFSGVSTDSRTIAENELFIPLSGPHFDGHLYIKEAYERSHAGALCSRLRPDVFEQAPGTIILVDDTLAALLRLAHAHRLSLPSTFIAVTGSNGKTTTKELLVHMLRGTRTVAFNERNYNNQVGVPKSLLAIKRAPRFAVFELGTNQKGEIRSLTKTVEPDVSLITNVHPSHLEGLGSEAGVLEEKLDLFRYTKKGGILLLNRDDPLLSAYTDMDRAVYAFSIDQPADFTLRVEKDLGLFGALVRLTLQGRELISETRLLGKHNFYNILAAAAAAHLVDAAAADIRDGIEAFAPYPGRFEVKKAKAGYTLIDDSYNANPASMRFAVATLNQLPCSGERIAIIGDMKELGAQTAKLHRELGRALKNSSISLILLFGEEVRETFAMIGNGRGKLFEKQDELIDAARGKIGSEDIVLVKGSRALKMDRIVEALL